MKGTGQDACKKQFLKQTVRERGPKQHSKEGRAFVKTNGKKIGGNDLGNFQL